jgi:hypothetical protein
VLELVDGHIDEMRAGHRAESWAAQEDLCVDLQSVVLGKTQCERTGTLPAKRRAGGKALRRRAKLAVERAELNRKEAAPFGAATGGAQ